MTPVPIFWVEPTGRVFYTRGYKCPNDHHFDRPSKILGIGKQKARCPKCNELAEPWCGSSSVEFQRPDTGETYRRRDLPPGAVYEAFRHEGEYHNWTTKNGKYLISRPNEQDGRVLVCILPDGHPWTIDSRCNNCKLPDDDKHWCWVRHGRPEDGTLHVDKNGRTCKAGAGSIKTGKWHGFLHHGHLKKA